MNDKLRDTPYAREIATARLQVMPGDEGRIERLEMKETGETEIRFSWWKDGKMVPRPLDLPEQAFLELFRRAFDADVFSARFQLELLRLLIGTPSFKADAAVGGP